MKTTMTGRDQLETRLIRWVLRISKDDRSIIDRAAFSESLCADIAKGSNGLSTRQVHYLPLQPCVCTGKTAIAFWRRKALFGSPRICN